MAIDLTLNNISSGYNLSKFNENFDAIETAFQDALSRSGTTPNSMNASIDLNGNDLLNVGSLGISGGITLADIVGYAEEWANKAEDSLVSTDAGGDGIDDYSALHWAMKAAADVIITNADVVITNADVIAAAVSAAAAAASAATINTPTLAPGDAGKHIKVNVAEDGYEFDTTVLVDADIGTNVQAYDATIVVDADIGVSVQGYDIDTLKADVSDTITVGMLGGGHDLGNLSIATTLHISDGNIQHATMTGDFTLTAPDDVDVGYCEVEFTIDVTGGYTLTVAGFNEISGTIDATANIVNILRITKLNTNTYLEITQAV